MNSKEGFVFQSRDLSVKLRGFITLCSEIFLRQGISSFTVFDFEVAACFFHALRF